MGAKSVNICDIQEPKELRSGVLEDNQQEGTKLITSNYAVLFRIQYILINTSKVMYTFKHTAQ
jgi:hypothetical protein